MINVISFMLLLQEKKGEREYNSRHKVTPVGKFHLSGASLRIDTQYMFEE